MRRDHARRTDRAKPAARPCRGGRGPLSRSASLWALAAAACCCARAGAWTPCTSDAGGSCAQTPRAVGGCGARCLRRVVTPAAACARAPPDCDYDGCGFVEEGGVRVAENAPACAHVEGRFGDVGNHFCQTADATWCAEPLCEAGSYSKTGRGVGLAFVSIFVGWCDLCAEGKYSSAGATSCTLCEAGSYQPQAASSHCISCARGKYSPTPGAKDEETCLDCAAGKYSTSLGASAMNTCKDCPPYSSSQQASLGCACDAGYAGAFLACKACAPGTFKLASGPAACATCAQGKFKDTDGAGACLDCPGNSSTMAEGATVCMCTPGFTGPNGSTCRPCNSGTFKSTPGSHACVDPAASAFAPEETDVMVRLILGLPLSVQEFTPDVQVQFRASISTTAGVPLEKVNIHEVTSMDLRRSAGAQVHVEVAASSSSAADSVTRSLSIENINAQLARDGMPPAVILEKAYVINLVLVDNPSEGASMGEAEAEGSVLKDLKDGQATATAVSKSQTTLILAAVLLGCAMLFVLMVALCMIARKLEKSGGTGDAGQTCGDKEHDMQILTDAGSYPASLSKDDAVTDKLAQHISRESARQQSVSSQELHGLVSPQMESPYGQMSNFRGSTGTANFFSQLVFPDSHNDLEASAWECFTLDLDLDYDTIGKDGSELRAMFLSDLQQDLSNALALRGILTRPHCFDIVHLSRGSVIADIVVVDLEQLSCPAHALIDELQLQALDASSPLFAGTVTKHTTGLRKLDPFGAGFHSAVPTRHDMIGDVPATMFTGKAHSSPRAASPALASPPQVPGLLLQRAPVSPRHYAPQSADFALEHPPEQGQGPESLQPAHAPPHHSPRLPQHALMYSTSGLRPPISSRPLVIHVGLHPQRGEF